MMPVGRPVIKSLSKVVESVGRSLSKDFLEPKSREPKSNGSGKVLSDSPNSEAGSCPQNDVSLELCKDKVGPAARSSGASGNNGV